MEKILELNSQTAGRDKLARLIQCLIKATRIKLQENNTDVDIKTLKSLESKLSSFRKLLRFGKCLDTAYSILSLLNHHDTTVKTTVILSKIFNCIFLLADHILWIDKAGLLTVDTNKWIKLGTLYGLYRLYINLIRDLYEILKILQLHRANILPKNGISKPVDIFKIMINMYVYIQKYPNVSIDIIKNSCDILVPLTTLGYINLSPYAISVYGVVSSLAGLVVLLDPLCKLSPI